MPELPEVEVVRKALERDLINKQIIKVEINYPKVVKTDLDQFKTNLVNQTIKSISRKAKYLIWNLDDYKLLIHLRMEGKFHFFPSERKYQFKDIHSLVIFYFNDNSFIIFRDERRFATLHLYSNNEFQIKDPLQKVADEPFNYNYLNLFNKLKNKRTNVKNALLDQSIISGLGNIYVDEVLFSTKIHPLTITNKLSEDDCKNIIKESSRILEESIRLGGSSIRSYTSELGVIGRYQDKLMVHTRKDKTCFICNNKIDKIKVGGRGTYFCSVCQIIK